MRTAIRIYLFGFSRGAFTVRMLAGMIDICGLCSPEGTEADLDRKARANYGAFRSCFNNSGLLTRGLRKLTGSDIPVPASAHPGIEFIGKPADFGTQKRKEYTSVRYHKPSDEVQPDWDLSGAVEDLQLVFHIGLQVANTPAIPTWREGDEFKARRDAMMKR